MSDEPKTIPVVETYRGVGIHDFQPAERIADVVKPAIDRVYKISDPAELTAYAYAADNPPEARLFAAAKCEAAWQLAVHSRERRPNIDMTLVKAYVGGLNSLKWIDPWRYGTLLDGSRKSIPRDPEQTARLRPEQPD